LQKQTVYKVLAGVFTLFVAPIVVAQVTREGGPLNPKETPTPTPAPVVASPAAPSPTPGPRVLEIRILDVKASRAPDDFGRPVRVKRYDSFSAANEQFGYVTTIPWTLTYSLINDGNESGQGCTIGLSQMVTSPRVFGAPANPLEVPLIAGSEEGNYRASEQFGIPGTKQVREVALPYEAEMVHWNVPGLSPLPRSSPLLPTGPASTEPVSRYYSATVRAVVRCRNGSSLPFEQTLSASTPGIFGTLLTPAPSPSPSPTVRPFSVR
jgi:hypothetical protein